MNIKLTIVQMGGGYKKAIIRNTVSPFDGESYPDAVYGGTDEELIERLRTRLPGLRLGHKKNGKAVV